VSRRFKARDTVLCPGEELFVDATTPGAENYRWADGNTDSVRTILETGTYALTVTGPCGSVADSFRVSESPTALTPVPDRLEVLCAADSLAVDLTTTNATRYRWDDGFTGPARRLSGTGTYAITVGNACTEFRTTVRLVEESCCRVYFPSAFSPNGDGVNDRYLPLVDGTACAGLRDWELTVYDRWGGIVFSDTDAATGWDGRVRDQPAVTGSYVYVLRYFDGLRQRSERGVVQLLR
ncbi:MAG: gliding motility-associated C-terminal domain-containing protein, partial [Bacteroidota bacterium]